MTFSKNFTWFFCLFGAALLPYAAFLSSPFLFDDEVFLEQNQWLSLAYVGNYFRSFIPISTLSFNGYRPLVLASFALEADYFQLTPWIVRLNTLVFHTLNAGLLFLLVQKNTPHAWKTKHRWLPYGVSMLFLLHPVQSNVIFLAWKRSDVFCAFGLLLSLWSFQIWAEAKKGKAWHLVLGFFGIAFAIFSKETALMIPLALALAHVCFWKSSRTIRTISLGLYLPVLLLWAAHAWIVFYEQPRLLSAAQLQTQSFMPASIQLSRTDYFNTQAVALLIYLRLCVLPNNLQIFHWIAPVTVAWPVQFFIGAGIATIAWIAAGYAWFRRHRIVAFAIFWFFLFLIPTSSFVPLSMLVDEDRLYLPLISFCILFAWMVTKLIDLFPISVRIFQSLLVVLLAVYASLILLRGQDWKSDLHLWTSNTLAYPQDPRAWLNLANVYSVRGMAKKAEFCFEKTLAIDPSYGAGIYFYGEHLLQQQRWAQAEKQFQKALDVGYLVSDSWMNLAAIQDGFYANKSQAKIFFQKSLETGSNNTMAMRNYARFLESSNAPDEALSMLKHALTLAPWEVATQLQIAQLIWNHRRDVQGTNVLLEMILKKHPNQPEALALLKQVQSFR